ncbi:MAG: hypothetical protein QM651_15165 [Rhodoblastus sp.]
MATVYQQILDNLKAASGPNEVLDRDIAQALMPEVYLAHGLSTGQFPWRYTALVDDAVQLIEKALPGWWWKCGTCSVSDDACIAPDYNSPIHGKRLHREFPLVLASPFDEGFDVDRRPSGNVAIALLESLFEALVYIEQRAN